MIDLTSVPEGATGYYVGSVTTYFYNGSKCWSEVNKEWLESLSGDEWLSINVVPLKPEWSIYNNDKPLIELSDEQAAELFNYYRNGGKVEVMSDSGEWCDAISFVGFGAEMSYRAKQKSDRELFIDAARLAGGSMQYTLDERELIVAMFDAGFKAPKVGE